MPLSGAASWIYPSAGWKWRWKIRDRTELDQEFTCLIPLEENWPYKQIRKEALKLHKQGLSYVKIAELLGVTDKTVKKAVSRTISSSN